MSIAEFESRGPEKIPTEKIRQPDPEDIRASDISQRYTGAQLLRLVTDDTWREVLLGKRIIWPHEEPPTA